jgi:hypothetical protein
MNRNETTHEVTETPVSPNAPLEFLQLVRAAAVAQMQPRPAKAKAGQRPDRLAVELAAALKPMSKSDAEEFAALLDAAIGGRCCYHEMVAAMLDSFGAKYSSHDSTVWLLGIFVLWALKDMGLPEGRYLMDLAYQLASGESLTKAGLAQAVGEDDALHAIRSQDVAAMLACPETLELLSAATLVLNRNGNAEAGHCLTVTAESAIARVAGLVIKARQGRRSAASAIPKALCVTEGAGLSGADAEYCIWLGYEVGKTLAWYIRCNIDRMATESPWLFGLRRALTSAEMMRDARSVAAA